MQLSVRDNDVNSAWRVLERELRGGLLRELIP